MNKSARDCGLRKERYKYVTLMIQNWATKRY